MSTLVSFGSSPVTFLSGDTQNKKTFPLIVAEKLGFDYDCQGRPNSSNSKIARKILSYTFADNDCAVAIWTSTVRFEFRTELGWTGTNKFTYKPGCGFEEAWYQGPGNWEYTGVHSTLKEIALAQVYLKTHNINYKFLFDNNEVINSVLCKNPDPYIGGLMSVIDWSKFIFFENQGFMPWCKNNFVYNDSHPTQEAHTAAADYVLSNW